MKATVTKTKPRQPESEIQAEVSIVDCTIHFFDYSANDKHKTYSYFSCWVKAGAVVKIRPGLERYLGRPLAVLKSDFRQYNHHIID